MNPIEFYSDHSNITNPGKFAGSLAFLPSDVVSVCGVVQGVMIDRAMTSLYGFQFPESRMDEAQTRYVEGMLAKISDESAQGPLAPRLSFMRLKFGTMRVGRLN